MRRLSVTCGWPVVLSGHSGFHHHLKLIFPTPLFSHSIAPVLCRQTLSMHVKHNDIRVKPTTLIAVCGNSRITEKMGSHVTRNNLERKQQKQQQL